MSQISSREEFKSRSASVSPDFRSLIHKNSILLRSSSHDLNNNEEQYFGLHEETKEGGGDRKITISITEERDNQTINPTNVNLVASSAQIDT